MAFKPQELCVYAIITTGLAMMRIRERTNVRFFGRAPESGTAAYGHPFQGAAVSPVLSDDGSIDKVWIGMAGRFGSV